MGGWKLEVGKMALYMTFPVGTFYFFNQPQYFEEWVTKIKREVYPPENPDHRRLLEETIGNLNKKQDVHMFRELEGKH